MIPNPWVLLAIVLTWAASLAAVGMWQNETGHTEESAKWLAKDNADLAKANKKILDLEEAARKTEQAHQAAVAALGVQYANDLQTERDLHDADVRDARNGALKLRIPGSCKGAGISSAPASSPAPAGRDDPATTELPGEVTADLFALADDADQVTRQLGACQAYVKTIP